MQAFEEFEVTGRAGHYVIRCTILQYHSHMQYHVQEVVVLTGVYNDLRAAAGTVLHPGILCSM
jgi:hypothetical protein